MLYLQNVYQNYAYIYKKVSFLKKVRDKSFWEKVRNNPKYSYFIEELTENYKRNMEPETLKDNNRWTSRIGYCVMNNLPFEIITDATTVPPLLTAETMKDLANQYLDLENYVLGILKPENVSK